MTRLSRRRAALLAALLALGAPRAARAELRKPNAAEKAVLDKYRAAISRVLDRFRNADWAESIDYSVDDDVNVNPDDAQVPLDVDELSQRSYDSRPGSPRHEAKIAPLMAQMEAAGDMKEKMKIGERLKSLTRFQVQVHFNRAAIDDIDPPPSKNADLKIPGAAYAYKIQSGAFGSGSSYALIFGDRRALAWDAEHGWYRYAFAHRRGTPAIENVDVRLYGADDRLQELLRTIDWRLVNKALTAN